MLLLDSFDSPFYKALIESGLGTDYSATTGFSPHTLQPVFGIGAQVTIPQASEYLCVAPGHEERVNPASV